MTDRIEYLGKSLIQHGPLSKRVYLMKLAPGEENSIVSKLHRLAQESGYTKIFAKVPALAWPFFERAEFAKEACIPDFFLNRSDCFFVSRFLNPERSAEKHPQKVRDVIEKARTKGSETHETPSTAPFQLRLAGPEDVADLCGLYKQVFPTYPFPITQPDYLLKTMKTHIDYFGVWDNGRLVAAASCEKDPDSKSVELTDFATLPECRGRGLASLLLQRMEEAMLSQQIRTAYTICRAYSYGMNIVFSKAGYQFGGTLVNNTQISGQIESMNIWHKHLKPAP